MHSLAGFDLSGGLMTRPPYVDPHHSASVASIVGGGPRIARPGAISCAHRGVLFLDEAPEFAPQVLDALRTPLESGTVSIARSELNARFPAAFQLVLAANPCPCGMASTPGAECRCAPASVRRYADKISGPVRDRVDIAQAFLPLRRSHLKAAGTDGGALGARRRPGRRGAGAAAEPAARARRGGRTGRFRARTCAAGCRRRTGPSWPGTRSTGGG